MFGNWNFGVIRYNADGSLDPSFNPGGGYGIAPNNQSMVVYSPRPSDDYLNEYSTLRPVSLLRSIAMLRLLRLMLAK